MRRALGWVGAAQIVGQACWYGSLLVLAALLTPSAFGTVTVGLLLVTAATRLMEAGTRGSIIVAADLSRAQVLTSLRINAASGLALSLVIVAAAPFVARTFAQGGDAAAIAALGLSVLCFAPAIVPLALLEKRFRFRQRSLVQTGATVTAAVLAVLAALLGAGVWALVVRQVALQALLAILGWIAARQLLPPRSGEPRWSRLRRQGATAFLLFSLTDMVVFNADYLMVGHFTDATELGLYSLAFTLAFAPVTQFSAQLGLVMFPASAASDAETVRRRAISGARLTCLLLVPLVPVAIALAPVLIPGLLGEQWRGMVGVFQVLLVVGVAHAVVNVIGDSLAGSGHIGWRARVNLVWGVAMLATLLVLVEAQGMQGAALAHLVLYPPVAVAYGIWGMRLLGARPSRLARALLPIGELLLVQAAVTLGVWLSLGETGVASTTRDLLSGAAAALAAAAWVGLRGRPLVDDARGFLRAGRRGGPATVPSAVPADLGRARTLDPEA
jgi:O-antigen/teichoic acid export membrane protein